MDVTMSSPVKECLGIGNDTVNAAVKVTKAQKRNRSNKLKKQLKANQEDTENPKSKPAFYFKIISLSSLQDYPNTDLGTSAIVEQKMTVSNPAAPVKKSSILGIENDNGNCAVKRNKSKKRKIRRKSNKKKLDANQEDAEKSSFSKSEDHAKVADSEMGLGVTANLNAEVKVQNKMETAVGETGSVTNATNNSTSRRQKRKKSKKKKPDSSDILSTHEIIQNTFVNVKGMAEEQNKMETAIGEMGSGPGATDDTGSGPNATTNVNVKGMAEEQNKMEMAIGETSSAPNATDDSSKKQKRKKSKNKNPGLSDILITHESTQDMVIAKNDSSTTINVNMKGMVEEQNKMETAICGSGPNATDDASKKKKRKKSKNKNPGSSDILCTHERTDDTVIAKNDSSETTNVYVKDIAEEQNKMKATFGETGSGKNTTDDTSKKRRRKVLENKNPGSSDFLSTHESMQEEVIAKNDSSTTASVNVKGMTEEQNKMETAVGETGSGTNTTDNTSKKQKRKKLTGSVDSLSTHKSTLETVIGKNNSTATTNVNLKGMAEEQNKPKSESGSPMVGDILNHQYLHNLEPSKGEIGSGTTAKDNTSSKKRRQKSKNTSPASGDIVGTRESREDVVIAKIESSTTNVLAALSGQMLVKRAQGEEHKKVAVGKTGSSAVTKVNDSWKKKNKPKMEKRPTLGEILNPQCLVSSAAEVKAVDIAEAAAKDKALITKIRTEREKQKMGIREGFQVAKLGKKLIVFDVNGLLADIVSPRPKDVRADIYVPRKAIFKRPFLEDFLCFCFERFNVGIWSSRTKENLDRMVDALLGDLRKKLLFLWDASECSKTGARTIEDRHKCIVFKNLRKIWERDDPNGCWVKGTFNASNTLLLDDSPYKALLNPKHTGIFPFTYSYKNRNDDFLGPEGQLRTYLEGLAACDNVKMYVQHHPLGQGAIDEEHRYWGFYRKVLRGLRPQFSSSVFNALEELELLEEQEALQELEILQQS